MKKFVVALLALLVIVPPVVATGSSSASAQAIYAFASLSEGQHLTFDPTADRVNFDSSVTPASSVRFAEVGGNLAVSARGKTIYLDGMTISDITQGNLVFSNYQSLLLVGDDEARTRRDAYSQYWDATSDPGNNQLMGLGGADRLTGSDGLDRLVGNRAKRPFEHVSRVGVNGSPTASHNPSVSIDGDRVAFEGGWTGFGSTNNNATDVVVKRVTTDVVSQEHRTAGGLNGLSGSGAAQLADDGRYVVFASSSGLVAGDPPSNTIYRADADSNEILAVSTTSAGVFANGFSGQPDISADGRYVVFTSPATNLAVGSAGSTVDIFTKDLVTGITTRVSTSTTGGDADADCATPRISADGAYIVFSCAATNLSANRTVGQSDIYVWFRDALVQPSLTNITGGKPGGANASLQPDIGADSIYGPWVAFETNKALVASDTNNQTDVYVTDGKGTSFTRASTTSAGGQVALGSDDVAISNDGRFATFRSGSASLVPDDTNGYADVFVKDLLNGAIARVSAPAGAAANQSSGRPDISGGGDWVVFESGASNLAATDTNAVTDVFRVANPLAFAILTGGAGNDTYVTVPGSDDRIVEAVGGGTDTVEVSGTYILTAPNVENITAPPGVDAVDDFTGNSGNNRIDPGLGNDIQRGSAGNDTYVTNSAADVLTGEVATTGGTDTVESSVGWTLQPILENLTLTGSAAINGGGNSADNVITANSGANTLTGSGGNDTLVEKGGNDILNGGPGNDTYVFSGASGAITGESFSTYGTDTVRSAVTWTLGSFLENLTLTGSATINGSGNNVNNVITGNSANNTLVGQSGADTYTGGGGADLFSIDTSATVDTVTDFTVGSDRFRMRQSAWQIGDGDLVVEGATNKIGPGGFSKSAEYVVISKNLASITMTNAANAIGSATSAYATGNRRIFMVDNGTTSQALLFISSGNDAKVTAAELKPLMTFRNRNAMSVSSPLFAA